MSRRAVALALAACVALAALSLLAPSQPTTDSWGWVVWGRELVHLHLDTVVGGAPSWKPLPVLVTAPLSLAGSAAPALWVLVARAAGLFSLVAAFLLGARLAGRWAGILAALGLALSTNWLRSMGHGYMDAPAIGLVLLAVERHLAGRRELPLLLGGAAALVRPEAFPLVLGYGLLCWRRHEARLPLVAAVLAIVPLLWVVPDWISSGMLFHANKIAETVVPTGVGATFVALGDALLTPTIPLTVAAAAAVWIAAREGDRRLVEIGAVAGGWYLLLTLLMLTGYPGSARYFALPASLVCVLGAAGVVLVARQVAKPRARWAFLAAACLAAVAFGVRAAETAKEADGAVERSRLEADLHTAIESAGPDRLRDCGSIVFPYGLGWAKGRVAWDLDVPLRRVRAFHSSVDGYVDRLAAPKRQGIPSGPPSKRVVVRAKHARFVLFAPFYGAPVRAVGHGSPALTSLASAGRWRVLIPARRPCAAAPGGRAASRSP